MLYYGRPDTEPSILNLQMMATPLWPEKRNSIKGSHPYGLHSLYFPKKMHLDGLTDRTALIATPVGILEVNVSILRLWCPLA